jgi:hypothetical protein
MLIICGSKLWKKIVTIYLFICEISKNKKVFSDCQISIDSSSWEHKIYIDVFKISFIFL